MRGGRSSGPSTTWSVEGAARWTRSTGHRAPERSGGDGGESNSPSRTLRQRPATSVSDRFRQPLGRRSAPCPGVQSRAPRSGLTPDYATLIRAATPLNDASAARGMGAVSTLTLPPKRRGRESTACWQVLRFAAGLTRPGDNLGSRPLTTRPCRDHASPQDRTAVRVRAYILPHAVQPPDRHDPSRGAARGLSAAAPGARA